MTKTNPIISHPRFEGLKVYADSNTEPSFDGAVCAQVGTHVWYHPDEEDPLGRGAFIEGINGSDNGMSRTYDMLADICSTCPALVECFNYAVHHEEWGFWGGATRYQRKAIRKTHGITLTEPFNSNEHDKMILETRALLAKLGDDEDGNTL